MFYCGIDIAKHEHEATVIDEAGAALLDSISFANSKEGCEKLLALFQRLDIGVRRAVRRHFRRYLQGSPLPVLHPGGLAVCLRREALRASGEGQPWAFRKGKGGADESRCCQFLRGGLCQRRLCPSDSAAHRTAGVSGGADHGVGGADLIPAEAGRQLLNYPDVPIWEKYRGLIFDLSGNQSHHGTQFDNRPHPKSKEAGKHPWCLPALITPEQGRAGRSMAAHLCAVHLDIDGPDRACYFQCKVVLSVRNRISRTC